MLDFPDKKTEPYEEGEYGQSPPPRRGEPERRRVPKDEDFINISELFRMLGDPTRLKLFWLLCYRGQNVTDLSSILGISSPGVSHHLKQLKEAGFITSERRGKEVYYRAASTAAVKRIRRAMEDLVDLPWNY